MQDIIPSDLFNHIIQNYLNPVDLFLLRQVSKFYKNTINKNHVYDLTLRNMNYIFWDIFGENLTEFKTILEMSHVVVSGSIITQYVLDEYWNSDIDIFIPYCTDDNRLDIFLREKMKFNGIIFDYCYHDHYFQMDTSYASVFDIMSYEIYHKTIHSIHIVWIEYDDLIKYLWNACDFDICRNVYYINNHQEALRICTFKDICTKTTSFKIGPTLGSTMERYIKYVNRGFNIIRNIKYEDLAKADNDINIFKIKIISDDDFFCKHRLRNYKRLKNRKNENNMYKLIEGNMTVLSLSEELDRTFFINGYIVTIARDKQSECDNKFCPLIFCESKAKHFHFLGCYRGAMEYTDFILVIID